MIFVLFLQRHIQNPVKRLKWSVFQKLLMAKSYYFRKTLHRRWLTVFWTHLCGVSLGGWPVIKKDSQPAFSCLKLTPYSSVYIVNFEHVIAGWAVLYSFFLLHVHAQRYQNILKLRFRPLAFTWYKAFSKKQKEVWN